MEQQQNQSTTQGSNQAQSQNPQNVPSATQPIEPISSGNKFAKIIPVLIIIVIVVLGIGSGLVLSSFSQSSSSSVTVLSDDEDISLEIKENLAQTFSDEAQGTLETNADLDRYGQGTHKLIRPGGEDQTAYLTSSILELDEYVGQEIKVYGETFGSSQVGWLMDVGKVEVIK